jgi:hypothetical protein
MIVTTEQVDRILAHARDNWGKNGWDMVYECMDLREFQRLADEMKCETFEDLFRETEADAKFWCEMEREIRSA